MNWKFSESFAGIGAWGKAIKRVTKRHGDTCELQWYAEIDKKASNAFSAIHGVSEDLNIWDITKDIEVKPMDIFFYSPPCQTFSIAGKRELTTVPKGNLFYDAVKFIKQTKPKYAIMENVRGLPSGDSKIDFNNMLWYLEEIGYHNDWKILNTKDYGIPQNRERVFIVSIRKDLYDQGKRFEFPTKIKLKIKLETLLDKIVNEKYYLSEKAMKGLYKAIEENRHGPTWLEETEICPTIDTRVGEGTHRSPYLRKKILCADFRYDEGLRIRKNGLSPCLKANMYKSTQEGDLSNPIFVIAASRGRDKSNVSDRTTGNKNLEQRLEINKEGLCNTLTSVQKYNYVIDFKNLKIRKLTPLECFRLQGFDDNDYLKAVESYDNTWTKGASNAQMYMRAGNSITVNVIEEILENLLYDRKQEGQQLSLF